MQPQGYTPTLSQRPSLTTRIVYFLKIWSLKLGISLAMKLVRIFRPRPRSAQPSIIKAYQCRPSLRNRIFVPKAYKAGELLPLYLDMHGGGHVFMDAQFDDDFCSMFANQFGVLVVSIEYSTAPGAKFPAPTEDVVAIANAIIDDKALPADKSRVVIGGFSAGGNLALSAAQTPELRGKIKGVVAWYPVLDFTLSPSEKQSTRPYRNNKDLDDLKDWGPIWEYAYIKPGQDLRDPLLSPRFAKRDNLPEWIYVIGAEYDQLSDESRQTMFDLASLDKPDRDAGYYEFEKGNLKWKLVRDVRHGFTHDLMDNLGAEAAAMHEKRTAEMVDDVGAWLFNGPFAK